MNEIKPIIDVVDAAILGRYVVELRFADDALRIIDLEPYLWGPMFERMRIDYDYFREMRVDPAAGTIVWPAGEDVSPRTLYAESRPKVPA